MNSEYCHRVAACLFTLVVLVRVSGVVSSWSWLDWSDSGKLSLPESDESIPGGLVGGTVPL